MENIFICVYYYTNFSKNTFELGLFFNVFAVLIFDFAMFLFTKSQYNKECDILTDSRYLFKAFSISLMY